MLPMFKAIDLTPSTQGVLTARKVRPTVLFWAEAACRVGSLDKNIYKHSRY